MSEEQKKTPAKVEDGLRPSLTSSVPEGEPSEEGIWEREQPSALERHADVFAVLHEFIDIACGWVHDDGIQNPEDPLSYFKLGVGIRALNLVCSIRLLLENDHWEDATIINRSLFELLINAEEVVRDENSATERADRFLKFGELQKFLDLKNNTEYEISRGTYSGDTARFNELKRVAAIVFVEFLEKSARSRGKGRKGHGKRERWATSWCGMKVKELCDISTNPMRPHQYRILYSFASNFAHAGPIVLSNLINHGPDFNTIKEEHERGEERRIKETVSMTISFCSDLFMLVGSAFPNYDPLRSLQIKRKIYPMFGKEAPPLPHATT